MSIRYGYFPSNTELGIINEYKGFDFNRQLKYLISDGVFATPSGTPSNYLQVYEYSGLQVKVKIGGGNFFNTWFEIVDEDELLTLDVGSSSDRIDIIAVEVNKNPNTLKSSLKIIKGTPATIPTAPTLINNEFVKQYPLAKIRVRALTTSIGQTNIEDMRGSNVCPWVTNIVNGSVDVSTILEQFKTAYWNWFESVSGNIGNLIMRRYIENHVTLNANERIINIPISEYDPNLDILNIYVEGRLFHLNVDYTLYNNVVTFVHAFPLVGTVITFEVFKAIEGTGAETYVSRLAAVEDKVNDVPLLNSDSLVIVSDVLTECKNKGVGFYTFTSASGKTNNPTSDITYRGFSSFTSSVLGYVFAISNSGDAFVNTYTGEWVGWRCIYSHRKNALWTGEIFAIASQTITPIKPLNMCANGWILTFAKRANGATTNDYITTYVIPKLNHKGVAWNGESVVIECPYNFSLDGATRESCYKRLTIYNDRMVGYAANNQGDQINVVLTSVIEF